MIQTCSITTLLACRLEGQNKLSTLEKAEKLRARRRAGKGKEEGNASRWPETATKRQKAGRLTGRRFRFLTPL